MLACWIIAGFACKEPYRPLIISSPRSLLVVEGILNTGNGPTTIRLTRTFKLDDTAKLQPELNALVMVEGKDNTTQPLVSSGNGMYASPGLRLVIGQEYRLKIKTVDGKAYASEYVIAKYTPAIDSLGWRQENEGVQLYVNTHDAAGNTRYYKWDYDETWEIRTYYFSEYKYENNVVTPRLPGEFVARCWKNNSSKNIIAGTSAKLDKDVIYRAPITYFYNGDEKLAVRYSIFLRQYALDKKGFEFYEVMKRNTESLGTIFDAQPSEQNGNIYCETDPAEFVIGYVTASEIRETRFFIEVKDLDKWRFYEDCPQLSIPNNPDSISQAYAEGLSIYNAIYPPVGNVIGRYYVSYAPCVDCTERGGDTVKPSYW